MSEVKSYLTHDNGGRPFKVCIESTGEVNVFLAAAQDSASLLTVTPQRTFVGVSPLNAMTESSGGHGPEFDGNSVLLVLGETEAVYVGTALFAFATAAPIVAYTSPVGNSDVPYAAATDALGNVYLMLERVVLGADAVPAECDDVYDLYYEHGETLNTRPLAPTEIVPRRRS